MTKLSVAIMAHPARSAWVPGLENRLGSPTVIWDECNSRWDTGRRSLLAHDPASTHHLIVQDDAILSKNFLNSCRKLIKHSGEFPIDLYMGSSAPGFRRRALQAQHNGNPWFLAAGPRWGVAVIIPVDHIHELVDFGDEDTTTEAYDSKMSFYYHQRKMSCLYTIPSLVNHREVAENPSLVAGRPANRTAFIYDGGSALGTDWTIAPDSRTANVKSKFRSQITGYKKIVNTYGPQYKQLKNSEEWVLVQ